MKIHIKVSYVKEFAKKENLTEFIEYLDSRFWYGRDGDTAEVDISFIEPKNLVKLQTFLKDKLKTDTMVNGALQKIAAYIKIKNDPDKITATNLFELESAMKEYIGKNSERKWLFKMASNNLKIPYLVNDIHYEPAKEYSPACTRISMKYIYLDEAKDIGITFHSDDLKQKDSQKLNRLTMAELLENEGYMIGVESLCEEYDKEMEIFMKFRDMLGEQFTSSGTGYAAEDRWSSSHVSFNTDGVKHKLVVNEPTERKLKGDVFTGAGLWDRDKDTSFRIPVHPYIRMFNLKTHMDVVAHTSTLTPYVYNKELIDKLVLPKEIKELIEILGNGTREGLGDIIEGKAEGIIVGCVGKPGLGKSLTAEIYSEYLERPLYSVQCAQLGTDPDVLEKRLNKVLERASRWKAVLLLDEADVYIRARGTDLVQNAIVGVFLRVLEYYPGILFMTSNLGNEIDQAIESRMAAKIEYPAPDKKSAMEIWAIQMDNHGWEADKGLIDEMTDTYPDLSGRGIRSLIKLATLLARFRKKDFMTKELLDHAAKFAVS